MTDNNELSQQAHERFAANVQAATEQQRLSGADPNTGMPPGQSHPSQQLASTVNQALLDKANAMQIEKDENGRRRYHEDSAFRAEVEAIRMEAFGGPAAVPVAQQKAQQPVESVGSPVDRLVTEVSERLDSGDVIEPADYSPELFGELSAGYRIADLLPAGFGLGATESEQLRAARYAGVPESQIRTIVAQLVKAQQQ